METACDVAYDTTSYIADHAACDVTNYATRDIAFYAACDVAGECSSRQKSNQS
ncbi:MAG: hypothetical protein WKF84_21815 [Pyrinomonadaceae bacterium]